MKNVTEMTREELEAAFEAAEQKRVALNKKESDYMRRKRLVDPEYFRRKAIKTQPSGRWSWRVRESTKRARRHC